MEETLRKIASAILDSASNVYAVMCGLVASILGYFIPIKDMVNLLVLFFILDVIFGYWAAKKINKERFSVKIIWNHTVPRMLVSIVLIVMAYLWDTVYEQQFVSTYKIVGWFLSGVIIWSIADNGYKITKWGVFSRLRFLFSQKVKDETGLNINDKTEDDENAKPNA